MVAEGKRLVAKERTLKLPPKTRSRDHNCRDFQETHKTHPLSHTHFLPSPPHPKYPNPTVDQPSDTSDPLNDPETLSHQKPKIPTKNFFFFFFIANVPPPQIILNGLGCMGGYAGQIPAQKKKWPEFFSRVRKPPNPFIRHPQSAPQSAKM